MATTHLKTLRAVKFAVFKCTLFFICINASTSVLANEMSALDANLRYCETINVDRQGYDSFFNCRAQAFATLRESTRFNSLKVFGNNGVFINQQMGLVFMDAQSGRLNSREELKRQLDYLAGLHANNFKDARSNLGAEIQQISERQAGNSSMDFLDRVMLNLAAKRRESRQDLDSGFTTYIFNGRMITCNRFGWVVNCK